MLSPPVPSSLEEAISQQKALKSHIRAEQQTFYTEVGNETGKIFLFFRICVSLMLVTLIVITSVNIITIIIRIIAFLFPISPLIGF